MPDSLDSQEIAPGSVIIPCYRCAYTIERAVRSAVGQVVRPVKVFLVDD